MTSDHTWMLLWKGDSADLWRANIPMLYNPALLVRVIDSDGSDELFKARGLQISALSTMPCKWCGRQTPTGDAPGGFVFGTQECDNCHEVVTRIEGWIDHEAAQQYLMKLLAARYKLPDPHDDLRLLIESFHPDAGSGYAFAQLCIHRYYDLCRDYGVEPNDDASQDWDDDDPDPDPDSLDSAPRTALALPESTA